MVKKPNGFTLIELLIVFAVIAVLTTLTAVNIQGVLGKVRDAKRKSDLKEIKNAINLFYNANSVYPSSDDNAHAIIGCGEATLTNCIWGQQWKKGNTVFMNTLPKDPGSNLSLDYRYRYIDANTFLLATLLENTSDPAAATSRNTCGYVLNIIPGYNTYTSLIGWDPTITNQKGLYAACP